MYLFNNHGAGNAKYCVQHDEVKYLPTIYTYIYIYTEYYREYFS